MKIEGTRHDGSVLLSIGGGMGVIMRGPVASKPLDIVHALSFGPWTPVENSFEARRDAQKSLDRARVVPVQQFILGHVPTGPILLDSAASKKDLTDREKRKQGKTHGRVLHGEALRRSG